MKGLEVALVKLGGSVVTDKSRLKTFAGRNTGGLADELSSYLAGGTDRRVIVVHGGGSFGHIIAKKFSIRDGFRDTAQIAGFAQVRMDMRELNARIIESLRRRSLNAISFPPESLFRIEDGTICSSDAGQALEAAKIGLIPVSFGDAVMDARRTFTILSGDSIMMELSRVAIPSVSVFCTDVDGIFTEDPKAGAGSLLRSISASSEVNAGSSSHHDVTGGMKGKLDVLFEVAKNSGRTFVVNGNKRGRLSDALNGRKGAGTEVIG